MVFMNMGGPSTTGEVGDFLSRLFVRLPELSRTGTHDAHTLLSSQTAT
jgi:protoheme ferro-lyase